MFQSSTPPQQRTTGSKSMLPLKVVIVKGRTTKRKMMKIRMKKKALERTIASQKKPQKMKRKMICAKPNKIAQTLIRKVKDSMILSR